MIKRFRWSDNVLEDNHHTIADITFDSNDTVVGIEVVQQGIYSVKELIGHDMNYFHDLLSFDSTGYHPETYVHIWNGKYWTNKDN